MLYSEEEDEEEKDPDLEMIETIIESDEDVVQLPDTPFPDVPVTPF